MVLGMIILLLGGFLLVTPAQAQFASSPNFEMEIGEYLGEGEVGMTRAVAGHNDGVEIPVGQYGINSVYGDFLDDLAGIYQNFPNATEASSLIRVSLDKMQIRFEGMSPGQLQAKETQVQFDSNIPMGYSLYLGQDQKLTLAANYLGGFAAAGERGEINDTGCDDGACTPTKAGVWQNHDVAGFGYNVTGSDALADFNGGKFRPFVSLNQLGAVPILVAGRANLDQVLHQRYATVRYQVGVAARNEAGLYVNRISFTVVPNF
jgi:hypothetical protein